MSADSVDSVCPEEEEGRQYYKCKLQVQAMTCASCVATIESHVSKLEGVRSVLVALMAGKAEVQYDPSKVQPASISCEISKLGFPCTVLEEVSGLDSSEAEVTISIRGMTCSSCVHSIETGLAKQPGVLTVSVALTTQRGVIRFDPSKTGARNVVEMVNSLGFTAALVNKVSSALDSLTNTKRLLGG